MYEPTHYLDKRQIYSESNVNMYHAYDAKSNRKVILKQIKYDGKHMLVHMKKDALMLSRAAFDTKNVTKIYDYYQDMDSFTLVMQYVDNALKLDSWLKLKPSLKERLNVFIKICEIIENMHKKHILHKDLCPRKIQITNLGEVYIGDFSVSGQELSSNINLSAFRAPINGECKYTDRSVDFFSLGILLFYILTDVVPVNGDHYTLIERHDDNRCDFKWNKPAIMMNASIGHSLDKLIKELTECLIDHRSMDLKTVIETITAHKQR